MTASEVLADAEAALVRLTEEEARLTLELGDVEARRRGIRRRLNAIADEREAWTIRAARERGDRGHAAG